MNKEISSEKPVEFSKHRIIREDIKKITKNISHLEVFEGKNVLITGGNGMIPSYLVYFFCYLNDNVLKKPVQLYIVVRKKQNRRIEPFSNKKYIHLSYQDICKSLSLSVPMHYIIHAASSAVPDVYLKDPIGTISTNILGLYNLFNLPGKSLKSFLFFSTAELYGNPDKKNIPTKEDYIGTTNFRDLRSCYVESKRFGEVLCVNYFRNQKIPIKIIRPFHVYSPEVDISDKRIFAAFVHAVVNGDDIEINGDGTPTRSLCYITDAIIMILKVLMSSYDGEVFNIGNQKNEISIKNLAQLIARLSGKKIKVKILGKKGKLGNAPIRSCPDMKKMKKCFEFIPSVDIKTGFTRVISYQQSLST
jgi:UDP-glucuronate decarboxylase